MTGRTTLQSVKVGIVRSEDNGGGGDGEGQKVSH